MHSSLALLALAACAPTYVVPDGQTPGARSNAPLLITTHFTPGEAVELTLTGAGAGQDVRILRSMAGVGAGPCVGTVCLELQAPVQTLVSGPADAAGEVTFNVTVPTTVAPGTTLALQALTWDDTGSRVTSAPLDILVDHPTVTVDVAAADAVLFGEMGTYLGEEVASVGDLNGDGFDDIAVVSEGDPTSGGFLYIVSGPVTGVVDLTQADARFNDPTVSGQGLTVAPAGDVDGDGFDDLIVGAPYWDYGSGPGMAFLLRGPVTGDLDLSDVDAQLLGEVDYDQTGYSVDGAGDLNGDGYDDVVVGAWDHDGGTGVAYVVFGPMVGDIDLATEADAWLRGDTLGSRAGMSVAGVGDLDADGHDDVIVGAYSDDEAGVDAGAAYVVRGPLSGEIDLGTADARILGAHAGDQAGYRVAGAGDTDGDGFGDVLITAPYAEGDAGRTYVLTGPLTGTIDLADELWLRGAVGGDYAGLDVASAGDVNGDGLDDVLIGAPYHDDGTELETGAVYLMYGPVRWDRVLDDAHVIFVGLEAEDHLGHSVSSAGDVDGDGRDDLLFSAPGAFSDFEPLWFEFGNAYLVLGASLP